MPREKKSEKKSEGFQTLLSVINIVITIITGIIISLYLADKNELLQVNLAKRQEDLQKELIVLQREAELTRLEVNTFCNNGSCDGTMIVRNTRSNAAKNVQIIVARNRLEYPWSVVMDNIDSFNFRVFPPSIDILIQKIEVDDFNSNEKNDAFQFTIETFPPKGELRFLVGLSPNVQVETQETERMVQVNIPNDLYELTAPPTFGSSPLGTYLRFDTIFIKLFEDIYRVAGFHVSVSCDNCEGITEYDFVISSYSNRGYKSLRIVDPGNNFDGQWQMVLRMGHQIPYGYSGAVDDDPLYLELAQDTTTGQIVLDYYGKRYYP